MFGLLQAARRLSEGTSRSFRRAPTRKPTPTAPARYLAFKHEGVAVRNAQGVPKAWISRRDGGDQIDYADESPAVRRWFAEALAKNGLKSRMDEAYRAEQVALQSGTALAAAGGDE